MVSQKARRRWGTALLVFGVFATAMNAFFVGWFSVWFQLFGDQADAGDYAVSTGAYLAGALIVVWAVPANIARVGPRWVSVTAAVLAGALVLAALAARASWRRAAVDPGEKLGSDVLSGVEGVVWAPWTWALVVLGIIGSTRLLRRLLRRRRASNGRQ